MLRRRFQFLDDGGTDTNLVTGSPFVGFAVARSTTPYFDATDRQRNNKQFTANITNCGMPAAVTKQTSTNSSAVSGRAELAVADISVFGVFQDDAAGLPVLVQPAGRFRCSCGPIVLLLLPGGPQRR